MATFEQIKSVRLSIGDPYVFINILEVSALPVDPLEPESQTAYKLTTDGGYYATEKTSGTYVLADYEKQDLQISDARLGLWIDSYGETAAICKALKQMLAYIGKELSITASKTGAESTEYTDLQKVKDYYKDLLSLCDTEEKKEDKNNTGTFGNSKQPVVAGGNI